MDASSYNTTEDSCGERDLIRLLEPLLQPRHYAAGHVLWAEGQSSGRLVVVNRGRIKAIRTLPSGRTVLLYVFSPGSVFGFLPFLDEGFYPATAVSVEVSETREVSRTGLRRAVREDPRVATALLWVLGKRLREAMARVDDQALPDATARVSAALLLLVSTPAKAGSLILDVPRPRYEFAADLGLTPESLSRALTRLVEAGVLRRLAGGRLQVHDLARLEAIGAGRATPSG